MPKKGGVYRGPKGITPSDVASQEHHDIGELTDFCAAVLEDANDHNIAAALRALNVERYELACAFINLEKDQAAADELTPELNELRGELLDELSKAEDEPAENDGEGEEEGDLK